MQDLDYGVDRGVEVSYFVHEATAFFFELLGVLELFRIEDAYPALVIERYLDATVVDHGC